MKIVVDCRLREEDLKVRLVLEEYAVADGRYTMDYVTAEKTSRSQQRGLWASEFTFA
jgi:endonuclease YncB( thermonuclease family)